MKKTILILTFLTTILISCKTDNGKKLYVQQTKFTYVDSSSKPVDSFYHFDKNYLEIDLSILANSSEFIATKEISKPLSLDNFTSISIYLVDENKKTLQFKSGTDFLNYMKDYGYEMNSKIDTKYGSKYVFNKK